MKLLKKKPVRLENVTKIVTDELYYEKQAYYYNNKLIGTISNLSFANQLLNLTTDKKGNNVHRQDFNWLLKQNNLNIDHIELV